MKKQVTQKKSFNKKPGFTLVEVAIAIGMMAVMISSFMVVFGPSIKGIDKSLSAKAADRLTGALELELSVLRNGETYATTFDKSFLWIQQSGTKATAVLTYQYRGNLAVAPNPDGTLQPYTGSGTPGNAYVLQTAVRRLNNPLIQDELDPGVLEGKVYYVKMTQLRYNTDGEMVDTTSPNNITNLYPSHDNRVGPVNYTEDAVLPFRARFYEVKPPLWSYINNTWSVADVGNPVITKTMTAYRFR